MYVELPYIIRVPSICDLPARISWIVCDESPITSDQMLAILTPLNYQDDDHIDKKRRLDNGSKNVIKAPKLDKSSKIKINILNETLIDSYELILGTIDELICDHLVIVHGLCADCNEEVEITEDSFDIDDVVNPGFITNESSMSISATFVKQMEESNLHSLLNKRLLCLVLDLDNTLIHAKTLDKNEMIESTSEYKVIYFGGRCNLYRLRPGVIEFLNLMVKYYQLYLFTMGTSEHASAALSLLDPKGILFSNRIFSRSDSHNSRKTLSRIFPNYQGIVCVVDDCEHAWRADLSGAGFFKIHPYYYFSERSKQYNALTAMITAASNQSFYNSSSKGDKISYDKSTLSSEYLEDAVDNDKMLDILGELLIKFHEEFFKKLKESSDSFNFEMGVESFKKSKVTLGGVMESFRSKVLKGVNLTFDPNDFENDFLNSDYIAWSRAFGATITLESPTHKLVLNPKSIKDNTIKEVHLMWLDRCIYTWSCVDEALYDPSIWSKSYRNFWDIFGWYSYYHLDNVCQNLINGNYNNALRHIELWQLRGSIPAAVAATQIILYEIVDESIQLNNKIQYCMKKRLSLLSMAFIRSLNLLVDQGQTLLYAKSISSIARELGIPETLIQLRHTCCHGDLPDFNIINQAIRYLLQLLIYKYWIPQSDIIKSYNTREYNSYIIKSMIDYQSSINGYNNDKFISIVALDLLISSENIDERLRWVDEVMSKRGFNFAVILYSRAIAMLFNFDGWDLGDNSNSICDYSWRSFIERMRLYSDRFGLGIRELNRGSLTYGYGIRSLMRLLCIGEVIESHYYINTLNILSEYFPNKFIRSIKGLMDYYSMILHSGISEMDEIREIWKIWRLFNSMIRLYTVSNVDWSRVDLLMESADRIIFVNEKIDYNYGKKNHYGVGYVRRLLYVGTYFCGHTWQMIDDELDICKIYIELMNN